MEKALSIYSEESEDEQRTRKGKRKKVDLFALLPDDILSDILNRLPDALLRYRAKYVCRRWMDLISNRILLDHASFIIRKTLKKGHCTAQHVGIREEWRWLQVKVQHPDIPRIGRIRSWVNELLLISSDYKQGKKTSLYVYNLTTKEGSYLPKCNASCRADCTNSCGVAISFDLFKGIYKVVHLYTGPPVECHILILTEDIVSSKWKKIQVPCIYGLGGRSLSHNPVSVQSRYIHWKVNWDVNCDKRVVSMDMVKEIIVDISLPLPLPGDRMEFNYAIFEMGGSLALFAGVSENKIDIWILKDFQSNKWEKLQSVTLEKWYYRRLPVCGVISSNKYIILKSEFDEEMFYYDLKDRALKRLGIHTGIGDSCVVHS